MELGIDFAKEFLYAPLKEVQRKSCSQNAPQENETNTNTLSGKRGTQIQYQNNIEEKDNLWSFVMQVLKALFEDFDGCISVYSKGEQNSVTLCEQLCVTETSYLVLVDAVNISNYLSKIEKFIHKHVFILNTDQICWQEGEMTECLCESDIVAENESDKDKLNVVFRKSNTVLPCWLDKYLFDDLNAKYSPEFNRFEYNLNLNKEENRVYLGTYFPRSYAEMFCILDNLFRNRYIYQCFAEKEELNILDFCCGTGGELFGVLTVFEKYFVNTKKINIVLFDGNSVALEIVQSILAKKAENSRHNYQVKAILKNIRNSNDLKDLSLPNASYDIEVCCKACCELISHNICDTSYALVAEILTKKLREHGFLVILDVTTKSEVLHMYYPQIMNMQLNKFVDDSDCFETLLPLSCANIRGCNVPCFMQQTFYVSHRFKGCDESRICYRVLCYKQDKMAIIGMLPKNAAYLINPKKFQQRLDGAFCSKNCLGENIYDSFNLNL